MRSPGMPASVSAPVAASSASDGTARVTVQLGWAWSGHEAAASASPPMCCTASTRAMLVEGSAWCVTR